MLEEVLGSCLWHLWIPSLQNWNLSLHHLLMYFMRPTLVPEFSLLSQPGSGMCKATQLLQIDIASITSVCLHIISMFPSLESLASLATIYSLLKHSQQMFLFTHLISDEEHLQCTLHCIHATLLYVKHNSVWVVRKALVLNCWLFLLTKKNTLLPSQFSFLFYNTDNDYIFVIQHQLS